MSIFDEHIKLTPEFLISKYKATRDKHNIYRVKIYTRSNTAPTYKSYRGEIYSPWITRSDITINLDRNEVFVRCFSRFYQYKPHDHIRTKYFNIDNSFDFDIIVTKYSQILLNATKEQWILNCLDGIHIDYGS